MPAPDANYELPGFDVSLSAAGLSTSPPAPGTKLTLLGITTGSITGLEVNEPYAVRSVGSAIAALKNTDGTESELSRALEQAVAHGARNIEVVKISETSSFATVNDRWDALAGAYNQLKAHPLDVVHAADTYVDVTGFTGTDSDGKTRTDFRRQMGDFLYQATVRGNSSHGVLGLRPVLKLARDEAWSVAPTSDAQEMFSTPTLAQVNEWENHLNTTVGTLDDHTTDTALAGHMAGSSEESPGVISTSYDGWALDTAGVVALDHLGANVDGGALLSIYSVPGRVASPSVVSLAAQNGFGGTRTRNTNGAVGFAALISTLLPWESATNRTIPGLAAARNIPETFGRTFRNGRIVTSINRQTSGFTVAADVTAAHDAGAYTKSGFANRVTRFIALACLDAVRIASEPYLGKLDNPATIAAMKMGMDQNLEKLKGVGAIKSATATIIRLDDDATLGNLDVYLEVEPYNEIRKIRIREELSRSSS